MKLNRFRVWFCSVAIVLACDAFAQARAEDRVKVVKRSHAAPAMRSELHHPADHPSYAVELEPHFVLQWTDRPYPADVGPGFGFRASIPVVDRGPIPGINNNLAVSFGLDWAHFGMCSSRDLDCGGDDFWFPAVMQWNFFLTRAWSVFPELGLAFHHATWSATYIDRPGPQGMCGPGGGPGCRISNHATEVTVATWLGTRYSISDVFSFVLRFGFPSLVAGVSFRI